jgi:hypothetical protein
MSRDRLDSLCLSAGSALQYGYRLEATVNSTKAEIQSLLQKLPDDCTLEDVQYYLYVIEKIRKGIERARVKEQFPRKRSKGGWPNEPQSSLVA